MKSGAGHDIHRGVAAGGQPSKWSRLLTEPQFRSRVLRHLLGLPTPLASLDRRVLEQTIFPWFSARAEIRRVLFVGCDWYTRHYEQAYFRDKDYVTLDAAPQARRYGARHHICAPLEALGAQIGEAQFDLILCNGVYGFGLDAPKQCERAFAVCHERLVDGGYLLLGWNDVPLRTPVPLTEIESLRRFSPFEFPPLGTWRYVTDTPYRHTYDFYRKLSLEPGLSAGPS